LVEDSDGPKEPCIRWGSRSPMRSGNFEGGEGRPIVKYRDTELICAKMAELMVITFGLWAQTGPRNHKLDRVQIPPWEGAIFWETGAHCKIWGLSAMSCAKTAEPVDLPFGLWTRVDQRKHKFSRIRQVAPMCPHGRAMQPYVKLL